MLKNCDICSRTLYTDGDKLTPETGWVVWFTSPPGKVVKGFHVVCHGTVGDCCAVLAKQYRGAHQHDHHLDAFTGVMATKRLAGLVCDYTWEKDVLEKCADFFVWASAMPSASLDRIEGFDMLMGGLPMAPLLLRLTSATKRTSRTQT